MSEGIAIYGKSMLILIAYESGASFYTQDPAKGKPENIISTLHRVPVAELAQLSFSSFASLTP